MAGMILNKSGGEMANEKNLLKGVRTQFQSGEQAAKNGKKGGIKSGKARNRKKAFREYAEIALSLAPDTDRRNELKACGVADEDLNRKMSMIVGMIERAEKGYSDSFREIKDILGEDGQEYEVEQQFSVPAFMLAAPFLAVYRDIRAEAHEEYVLYGGRGSAKSSFVSLMIIELLKGNGLIHAVVCRKVKDTLRDSVYAQLVWAIGELGLEQEFVCKVSPLEIVYRPTGQKIYFRGADDPGKLKSIKPPFGFIGILWFEELDQYYGEEEIRNIEQSVLRGGEKSLVFKTFNPPKTTVNWANRYLRIPKEKRYEHYSTYLDVPREWLGKQFIDDAAFLKEVNPRAYEHEYLGIANGTGGNVFENVTVREISDQEILAFDRIYRGIDWGWYPDPFRYHAMHYQANERTLYLFDEISGNKLNNKTIASLLREHHLTGEDKITADSGGEGKKSVADFRSQGFFMREAVKGPGSVEYSMKWLSSLNEIVIDPKRCPKAAEEFLHYEYERDRTGDVISGYPAKNNHSIDAVRYALEEVWRRRGQ